MNYNPKPNKPTTTLVMLVVGSILAGLWFFFMYDELYFKVCAFVIPIAVSSFAIYAFFHEKNQDKRAAKKMNDMTSGEYFDSSEWREKYLAYKMKHAFETPKKSTMRADLLKRYRRRDDFGFMLMCGAFAVGGAAGFIIKHELIMLPMTVFFAALFAFVWKDFSGSAVKKWLDSGADFSAVEESYLHGKMLTYKTNGINLGTTHIVAYKKEHLYAVDHDIIEDVDRKIVRVKNYDNSVYAGDEYRHFVRIYVRDPDSGKLTDIGIELDEFQVQMVIDEFRARKNRPSSDGEVAVGESYRNSISP